MTSVEEYIQYLKNEIESKNITDELSIIKFVYIDFGKRISFDSNFIPFGNSRYKQNLYKYHSHKREDLDYSLSSNTGICKSMAFIISYVLKEFDVDVRVVVDQSSIFLYGLEAVKYPHVYNMIKLKDGREFAVDIQDDIHSIQTNSFNKSFGTKTLHSNEYVIGRQEQEVIDKNIGYISSDKGYMDQYLYFLHYYADAFDNFLDKVDFILSNIDYYPTDNMGYIDRQWHHKTVLEDFFNSFEFDYATDSGNIKFINAYKLNNDEKEYTCYVQVYNNHEFVLYRYNIDKYKYEKVDLEEVARLCLDGLIIYKSKVHGLDREIQRIKNNGK